MGFALAGFKRRLARVTALALILCMGLTPCANAAFTLKDEIELGEKFNVLIRSRMPLVQDPEVVAYMNYIMRRFTSVMPPQPVPFRISVICDNSLNAFAVPGGYIFVHSGLITAMNSEDELAGVIAHEMAHVTQRHIAGRIENSSKMNFLALAGMLAGVLAGGDAGMGLAMGGMAAAQSSMLSYSRADESEADQVGMNYFLAAGYPPEGMVSSFRIIQRPQWVTGADIPTYLSTHPAIPDRVSDLSARIANMKVPQKNRQPVDNSQFLRVQTLVRARYATTETAEKFFNEQLKGPDKALAWLGLGILHERNHKINDASRAFDEALKLQPNDQIFLREAGRFNYLKGDKNKSIRFLQQATAQNPRDYIALFYYARLLEDAGQTEQALSYYSQVLRLQPEDAEVHEYYAKTLGKNKQMFQAHLHLAYSDLYSNRPKRTEKSYEQAKKFAESPKEKAELENFERKYAERKTFWKR